MIKIAIIEGALVIKEVNKILLRLPAIINKKEVPNCIIAVTVLWIEINWWPLEDEFDVTEHIGYINMGSGYFQKNRRDSRQYGVNGDSGRRTLGDPVVDDANS